MTGLRTTATDIAIGGAWMQKHPTPTRSGGEFHWHPAGGGGATADVRGALAELATRAPDGSAWVVGDGVAAWGRAFSAVAPSDRRRYVGVAAAIATGPAGPAWAEALPGALAALALPAARPWSRGDGDGAARVRVPPATAQRPPDTGALSRAFGAAAQGSSLARALVLGGGHGAAAPHDPALPAAVGALLSWLPPGERVRPRGGAFGRGLEPDDPPTEAVANLCHYLGRAWSRPTEARSRAAWRLVLDLARSRGQDLGSVFRSLTRTATAWERAGDLEHHLVTAGVVSRAEIDAAARRAPAPLVTAAATDAGWLWNRLLHYWGRGFVAPATPAQEGDLARRLAGALAERVAVDHLRVLDGGGPALAGRYLRRLAYEALLPREDALRLRAAVLDQLPSLTPEVSRG